MKERLLLINAVSGAAGRIALFTRLQWAPA